MTPRRSEQEIVFKRYRGEFANTPDEECFDALPRPLRDAVNYADFKWAVGSVFELWIKGKYTVPEIVELLRSNDATKARKLRVLYEAERERGVATQELRALGL